MKKLIVSAFMFVFLFSGWAWGYPTNGLVSYYGFNDSSNPTSDETGNHDGTNYGAEYVSEGVFGGAFRFSGNDYIDLGEGGGDFDLYENTKMTIAMWVMPENPSNPPDFWQFELLNKIEQNIYDGWHFNLGVHHGAPVLPIGFAKHYLNDSNSPAMGSQDDPSGLAFDQWYHLAAVINGADSTFYVNGVEVVSISWANEHRMDYGNADNERHLYIGANPNPIYRTYATIDEVFIYNSALNGSEIQELYGNAPIPEPATMFLLGSGLVGLAGFRKKLKK